MAGEDYQIAMMLGPFKGFDTRTSPLYMDPNDAVIASNADTHRLTGSLCNFFGRSQFALFSILGTGAVIASLARYVASPARVFYIVQTSTGETAYLDTSNGEISSLSSVTTPFTQGVQSNGVLYCNNGQQIFLGPDGFLHSALWQYPAPNGTAFQYSVTEAPPNEPGALEAGTYDYAFVQLISIPMADGTIQQYTSPTGADSPYPYTFTALGTIPALINNVTDPDTLIGIAPAIWPQINTSTRVTVTSAGSGKFNVSDTLGTFIPGVAAGTVVNIAGSSFTLTSVTDIPPGTQSFYNIVADSVTNASIGTVSDVHGIIVGTATVVETMSEADTITITSNGTTYSFTDTAGAESLLDQAPGSTVTFAGVTVELNASPLTTGDEATIEVIPMVATPATITGILDAQALFAVEPAIVPNVPADTTITIKSLGNGKYTITDTLGNTQANVVAGSYVFIDGSYFALTYATAPTGETATFAIVASVPGRAAMIDGIFSGTTDDGYAFVTQVFRQSSNQPLFFLLTTLSTNGPYIDYATDQSISGNQQLILNSDQPMVMQYPGTPIAVHQDRTWSFAIVNNANTNGFPQTQLGYSSQGQPWQFNLVDQTQLVEDDDTPMLSASAQVPAGQLPSGMISMGSSLLVQKNGSTFIEVGVDEDTYQPLKLFPDIGLIAPASLFEANGLVPWLAAQGPFIYDGNSLQWIGKEIYNALQQIPPAQQVSCVGFYGDQQIFFSFPEVPITFVYYLPDKTWTTLPYAASAAVYASSYVSNPLSPSTSFKWNEIIAARPSTAYLDAWLNGLDNDLGAGTAVTWKSKIENSKVPQWQKDYKYVNIEAPQSQSVATVIFQADPGSPNAPPPATLTFNLAIGPYSKSQPIPQENSRGSACQVTISFTTPVDAAGPTQIDSLSIGFKKDRAWIRNADPVANV